MKKIIGLSCGRKNGFCEALVERGRHGGRRVRYHDGDYPSHVAQGPSLQRMPGLLRDGEVRAQGRRGVDTREDLRRGCCPDRQRPLLPHQGERLLHEHQRADAPHSSDAISRSSRRRGSGRSSASAAGATMPGRLSLFPRSTSSSRRRRVLVDQIQFNYCGMKEWNPWLMKDVPRDPNRMRAIDRDVRRPLEATAPQPSKEEFHTAATKRARELGRNVARAMSMPDR